MSVVCAVHQNAETWIASDSLQSRGDLLLASTAMKWTLYDGLWLGHAGDARVMTILNHAKAEILKRDADQDFPFSVAESMREVLLRFGIQMCAQGGSGAPSAAQSFILATRAAVYGIDGTFHVSQIDYGWLHAIGSGSPEAAGAGFALRQSCPKIRVTTAVEAACALDAHCGGTIFVQMVE